MSDIYTYNYGHRIRGNFCAIGLIYSKKYNILVEVIDNEIPEITFNIKNPFLKIKSNGYKK